LQMSDHVCGLWSEKYAMSVWVFLIAWPDEHGLPGFEARFDLSLSSLQMFKG